MDMDKDNEKGKGVGKGILTVGQFLKLLNVLEELPGDTPIRGEFKFSVCSSGYAAVLDAATVEIKPEGTSIVLHLRETERETAALKEAMAA